MFKPSGGSEGFLFDNVTYLRGLEIPELTEDDMPVV